MQKSGIFKIINLCQKTVGFLMVAMLCLGRAYAAEMVNVEYIHNAIKQKWDITVPYNAALENPRVAANMKYLLTAVDVANEMLNGGATTDYGNGEFATLAAADTIATNTAVETLVKFTPKFFITTNSNVTKFKFDMSARGRFFVDWGDGTTEIIDRATTADTAYEHTYASAGEYKIKLGGVATGYATDGASAIRFENPTGPRAKKTADIVFISGSLGAIFPTIGDGSAPGTQPSFQRLFYKCSNMVGEERGADVYGFPPELMAGVHGAPIANMFKESFYGCTGMYDAGADEIAALFAGLRGAPTPGLFWGTFYQANLDYGIPENLFAGIRGAPAPDMFRETFYNMGIYYEEHRRIPSGLFAGIRGAPAERMFMDTFSSAQQIEGEIPEDLFSGIDGVPAESMFEGTFRGCAGITGSIPENLFAGVRGAPAKRMFAETFGWRLTDAVIENNIGLSGEIPENLFAGIVGAPAEGMFDSTFGNVSQLTGTIPARLFAGISGAPAPYMFNQTFAGCTHLVGMLPSGFFAGISGAAAPYMFNRTFMDTLLTSFGDGIFGDLSGAATDGMFTKTFDTGGYAGEGDDATMTGLSARTTTGKFLYEIWPDATIDQIGDCYGYHGTQLEDYADMPQYWVYH